MPYLVQSAALLERFPDRCAFCASTPDGSAAWVRTPEGKLRRSNQATTSFTQSFSRLKFSWLGGHRSETITPNLPACERCADWFRNTRTMLYGLGAVAITGVLWAVLAAMWFESQLPLFTWFATIAGWAVLRLWRGVRRRALRLAYFGDQTFIYAMREESYARELAAMNGLTFTYRFVLVRLA